LSIRIYCVAIFERDVLKKRATVFSKIKARNNIKIYKNYLQSHAISGGHTIKVSLQKGHLKVTKKRESTYGMFVSA